MLHLPLKLCHSALNRETIKEESCAAEAEEEGAVDGLPPSSEWTRRGQWYIIGPVGEYD